MTDELAVPAVVANKARLAGALDWLAGLPALVAELQSRWALTVGSAYQDATEAFVARADLADGTPAVLKVVVPRGADNARNEIRALRLAGGSGCARLLDSDESCGALLLERLGRSMSQLHLPAGRRQDILCDLAGRIWRPAPDSDLPTGADKAHWLAEYIPCAWEDLGRPCGRRAVEHALACATRRRAAYDERRALLLHGDVHQWNALEAQDGFALVDPDGLLAEPEYDLGVIMREDPVELLAEGPRRRAERLAARTGRSAEAIWEWGVVERVSTGLLCTGVDLQPVGRDMLAAADAIARDEV